MANFVLADADAVLVDYFAGSETPYYAQVPISVSNNALTASLKTSGTALEQSNLVSTYDGDPLTSGTLPILRLKLAGSDLPALSTGFTLTWALTAGLDGDRKSYVSSSDLGEKQVSFSGLNILIDTQSGRISLHTGQQTITVSAYRSSSNAPITQNVSFTSNDKIGEIYIREGEVFLDLSFMAVVSKLDSMASLYKALGYQPSDLLSVGDYHLALVGLPFESTTGASLTSISMAVPISASANQAPQIQAIADQSISASTTLTLAATDPESESITYSVVSGGSAATVEANIQGNQLTLTPASGYTTTQPIAFTVKASDSLGAYTTQQFDVTVVDPASTPSTITAHYWGNTTKPISAVTFSGANPAKETLAADKVAITLSDVLTTLKYYLGKTALTGYAVQAADYNDDGKTTLSDVLAILKAYLGKSNPPAWEFEAVADTNPVEYVGILKGDVNGSWLPPAE